MAAPFRRDRTAEKPVINADPRPPNHDKEVVAYTTLESVASVLPVAMDDLFKTRLVYRPKAIQLVRKILDKISKNPDEDKFRTLKGSAIKKKFANAPAAMAMMRLVGFGDVDGVDQMYLAQNRTEATTFILKALEDRCEEEETRLKDEREAIKNRTKAKMAKLQQDKDKKKSGIRARIADDKQEKKNRPKEKTQASKASDLKFGSKDVKVKFSKSK